MGDLISRQAVLDMANTWTYNFCDPEDEWQAMKEIRDLPSTQPEIIRCKDCTYRNGDYCHRFHDGYSAFIHLDDFCNYAERRTDE